MSVQAGAAGQAEPPGQVEELHEPVEHLALAAQPMFGVWLAGDVRVSASALRDFWVQLPDNVATDEWVIRGITACCLSLLQVSGKRRWGAENVGIMRRAAGHAARTCCKCAGRGGRALGGCNER